ncbi:unnamed protein product, partial [marine sediment metagenome]
MNHPIGMKGYQLYIKQPINMRCQKQSVCTVEALGGRIANAPWFNVARNEKTFVAQASHAA